MIDRQCVRLVTRALCLSVKEMCSEIKTSYASANTPDVNFLKDTKRLTMEADLDS